MAIVTKGNEGNEPMADDERSDEQAELRKDEAPEPEDRDEDERQEARPKKGGGGAPPAAVATTARGGFFSIYKPGQGYWVRLCTALGAGLLVAVVANFMYQQLTVLNPNDFPKWAAGITAAFVIGSVILLWRYLNKPSVVDFFVATESEMKKVNWTSRKELIGSTKVVIVFMFLIASILFAFDVIFGYFFQIIHVLKYGPFG